MDNNEVSKGVEINFAKEKSPLQKVGEFIREGRQAKNISVEDLSSSLRIGKEQLTALEKGDEKALPEKVFIKAMVRRIAEKLQLKTDFILEELDGRTNSLEEVYKLEKKTKSNPKKSPMGKDTKIISLIIIPGLLGIFSSFFLIKLMDSNQDTSLNNLKPKQSIDLKV